jgi:hypothetical protein
VISRNNPGNCGERDGTWGRVPDIIEDQGTENVSENDKRTSLISALSTCVILTLVAFQFWVLWLDL